MENEEAAKEKAEIEQRNKILKIQAIRVATFEVLGEQRLEIITRAAAKLTAMGIKVDPGELNEPEISKLD